MSSRSRSPRRALLGALAGALAVAGACERARREGEVIPAVASDEGSVLRTSELRAGAASVDPAVRNPYAGDAIATAEGKRLYAAMNCVGCHGGAGGGGIGPPLADADWIYGGQPENIVEAILQGRPNGMPGYGGRLPPADAWKIAAYVITLAADAPLKPEGPAIGRK